MQQVRDCCALLAPVLAPIAIAGYAFFLDWLAFMAAHAAQQTKCLWSGSAWITSEAEPQLFRAHVVRDYRLAAFEWLLAVCLVIGAVLLWSGIVRL